MFSIETKQCSKCKEEKPMAEFIRDKRKKTGYKSACKSCDYARQKEYRDANKNKERERKVQYREENREKVTAAQRKWRQLNPEKAREHDRRRRSKECPKKRRARMNAWRDKNREYVRKSNKEWRDNNPDKVRKRRYEYEKQQRQTNIDYKLKDNLRRRLHDALKNNRKAGSAVRGLGCSIEELKSRFEKMFYGGMSWDNWGELWQVDHIYPLAKANLEDRAEFLAVNNWRNLQPLPVGDNYAKNDKVTPEAQKLFDNLCKEFNVSPSANPMVL